MNYKWEERIRKVEPYTPGEQPKDKNIIKLNTNENPYGPSDKVKEVIKSMDMDLYRRYPDPASSVLVDAIADYYKISHDKLFVGVGSDDVLGMAFMTFFNGDKPIIFPDITYSFYPVWAEMLRIPYETKPLDENFCINREDYICENGGIVIANPNAPTGIIMDKSDLIYIIENNRDSIVIVDEAYIDFAEDGASMLDYIDKYDNLLVVRTFSKSRSLAGLRIGFAMGNSKLIKYMNDVKYSYNSYTMNYPSQVIGAAVMEDDDYFKEVTGKIVRTRETFVRVLKDFGFTVLPSETNFVFAAHPDISGEKIFEEAKKQGIYFRHFNADRIDNFLRITIGTDEEMEKVKEFLTSSLHLLK